jgi:hypothetical protein
LYIIYNIEKEHAMNFKLPLTNNKLFNLILTLFFNLIIIYPGFAQSKSKEIGGVYRLINEKIDGYQICIIDGPLVRQKIYDEFLYGGNEQRYLFIPKKEIWIDNSISVAEYKYTVAHELNERHLMAVFSFTYADAHDSSLRLERQMRLSDEKISLKHESELPLVSPYDCDRIKEIPDLGDSIKLRNIYLQQYSKQEGITIWIVDGASVRRDIYPDFGLSGNDLAYYFIPKKEIWIDAQISCEETEFSIICELRERDYMLEGDNYDSAYDKALLIENKIRDKKYDEVWNKPLIKLLKENERDRGTGNEKK